MFCTHSQRFVDKQKIVFFLFNMKKYRMVIQQFVKQQNDLLFYGRLINDVEVLKLLSQKRMLCTKALPISVFDMQKQIR